MESLGRYVPPGYPRAPGGDDHIDFFVGNPGLQLFGYAVEIVGNDYPVNQLVSGLVDFFL